VEHSQSAFAQAKGFSMIRDFANSPSSCGHIRESVKKYLVPFQDIRLVFEFADKSQGMISRHSHFFISLELFHFQPLVCDLAAEQFRMCRHDKIHAVFDDLFRIPKGLSASSFKFKHGNRKVDAKQTPSKVCRMTSYLAA
jgi:predicted metallopeptidase